MKIKDISRTNGREIVIVAPDDDITRAVDNMFSSKIGALPVLDKNRMLVGILSERDIIRGLYQHRNDLSGIKVKDLMTTEVIVGVPEDDLEQTLRTMTEKGVRHLPIMVGPEVVGMLSIRDVIEERLTECTANVRFLNDYITGGFQ